jgi:hypothetical protein
MEFIFYARTRVHGSRPHASLVAAAPDGASGRPGATQLRPGLAPPVRPPRRGPCTTPARPLCSTHGLCSTPADSAPSPAARLNPR